LNEEVPTNVSCETMVQKANASGKARGYADVDPAVRKVENESDQREESTLGTERQDE
jgi:hypothetical protein